MVVYSLDCTRTVEKKTRVGLQLNRRGGVFIFFFYLFIFISPHQEDNMDVVIWFCGCILPCLLPSAVKAEEVGKFDTLAQIGNGTFFFFWRV